MNEHSLQPKDDLDLLDLMIEDQRRAPVEYRPTARWLEYSERLEGFLRSEGLRDFRSTRHPKGSPGAVLASFGAVDINPPPSHSPEDLYHAAATCFLGDGGVHISELLPSRIGNPDGFTVEGRFYTLSWLNFYCRYAYVSKFINLNGRTIVEVGSGSGKQAEILRKAHRNLTIVLFDLPTQLYVANQYLTSVFTEGEDVVSYRTCREFRSFDDIQRGKINLLPHWKFPLVHGYPFDLLWNAASFQEMDRHTALGYLSGASSARSMFLMHNIKYKATAPPPGERGVIDDRFIGGFKELDRSVAKLAFVPRTWLYFDSFWERAEETQ